MKNKPSAQNKIPYGYCDLNNNMWVDAWVDFYNRLTEKINQSTHRDTKEFYLDQRHRIYVIYMAICSEDKEKVTQSKEGK